MKQASYTYKFFVVIDLLRSLSIINNDSHIAT